MTAPDHTQAPPLAGETTVKIADRGHTPTPRPGNPYLGARIATSGSRHLGQPPRYGPAPPMDRFDHRVNQQVKSYEPLTSASACNA